ncbi:MAG: tetratricopeptide repeat protein [Deltaproteobacteria bacterium]|nr:tetratricopeptide repeat protein [Deltaproteobacteria bacterium]
MSKKRIIIIVLIAVAAWVFAISTGSLVVQIIVGVLTLAMLVIMGLSFRMLKKQKRVVSLLQGSTASPEARKDALAKLAEGKDANSPTSIFARAQLQAQDDPGAALRLLDRVELKAYPPMMQDDVSLLRVQLCLGLGRTQDARKSADLINLDNPQRAQMKAMASAIIAEAWARTGKSKDALALIDTIEYPKENRDQIEVQARISRIFARFAANQRGAARNELNALANDNPDYLGKFVLPQFKVHPELQKLARSVLQSHPSSRQAIKGSAKRLGR